MKKIKLILSLLFSVLMTMGFMQSCSTSQQLIADKSGAQLWGENCIRCHNIPSPVDFNDAQWKTIGLHMQDRANLTTNEEKK